MNLKKSKAHDLDYQGMRYKLKNFLQAAVNAQRLDFIEKQMSINVFHTISLLTSIILAHVNYVSYIHTRWRRNYLTIDMFKFTDVTASYVLLGPIHNNAHGISLAPYLCDGDLLHFHFHF